MLQGGQDADAGGVDEVAVVREDVHVGTDGPDFVAGYQAEGLGVQGCGAPDGFFEDAGEEDFRFRGAVGFEVGGGHGGELGGYLEEAVEAFVWVGGCYFCGDVGVYSVRFLVVSIFVSSWEFAACEEREE